MAAQAARLNLRMQKEVKLLLTDPPPGSSFPSLSASVPSLSSIDAQLQGPEGTVYASGIFKLKIQIPDRYPFQPPMVTFATPIYHPNIDNGGRICLDILNLPPKGAWQPSLNISTVLTSIGLLLSEPNPDDGLMHEASQEYKYNRQAFDQKARSMTEKYARIDANEIAGGGQCSETLLKPSVELTEAKGMDTLVKENRVDECEVSHKRLCGISRKLSLDSSEFDHRCNEGKGVNQVESMLLYEEQMELKGLKKDSELTVNDHNQTNEEPKMTRKKLSLESSVSLHVKHDNDLIDLESNQCSSTSKLQSLMAFSNSLPLEQPALSSQQRPNKDDDGKSKANSIATQLEKKELLLSLESSQKTGDDDENLHFVAQPSDTQFQSCKSQEDFPLPQTIRHNAREPDGEIVNGFGNGSTWMKHKRLGLAGRKVSLGTLGLYQNQQKDNIENLAPNTSFCVAQQSKNPTSSSSLSVTSESGHYERDAENYTTHVLDKSPRAVQRQPLQNLGYLNNSNNIKNQCQMHSMEPSKLATSQHDSCHGDKQQPKQDWPVDYIKPEGAFPTADADSVIVLDSEDSDDEQGRVAKPKLSFARRRLLGKSKSSIQ